MDYFITLVEASMEEIERSLQALVEGIEASITATELPWKKFQWVRSLFEVFRRKFRENDERSFHNFHLLHVS